GIEQVNLAITQMDEMTQQNAALVEQAAAAAESMEEQAQALAQAVSIFKLGGLEGLTATKTVKIAKASVQASSKMNRPAKQLRLKKEPSSSGCNHAGSPGDEWDEF
ncbi:hypothetical protein ACO0K4_12475, partial [Undibacterium sp. RuTC16W]